MTINAGVWIDHHKAVVVLLTDDGSEVRQILFDGDASARFRAGLRVKQSYTPSDVVPESKHEQMVTIRLNDYYDAVFACVREAQAILILGPSEAKAEFRRRITRQNLRSHIAEMKTITRLSDDQIMEYVRQHFR